MKAFLPKLNHTDIDLADYGGEGILRVNAMSLGTSQSVTADLQKLAFADGYTAEDFKRKEAEINAKYAVPMMLLFIEKCALVEDEDGFRKLTKEEIEYLPPQLASDIYEAIMEMNEFPLVQNGGEASRKEPSKPTSAE